jgi:hypothetical protein
MTDKARGPPRVHMPGREHTNFERSTMQELDRKIEELSEGMDITLQDARGRLQDDDLLLMGTEGRYGFTGEEAVVQWRGGVAFARALARMAEEPLFFNDATRLLVSDLIARAEEFLRRAEERLAGDFRIYPEEANPHEYLLLVSGEERFSASDWHNARVNFFAFWGVVGEADTDTFNDACTMLVQDAVWYRAPELIERAREREGGEAG